MSELALAQTARFRFDSQNVPGADRAAVWREVFGRQAARLDLRPTSPDAPYRSEISALALPGLSISYCNYERVRSERTRELTSDGRDDLIFGVVQRGAIHVSQSGRDLSIGAGQATILASGLPNVATAHDKLSLFNIVVPRSIIAAKAPGLEDRLARPVEGDPIALALLGHYARSVFQSDETQLTHDFLRTAADHMYDLVTLSLGGTREGMEQARRGGMRAARTAAIKSEVAKHYRKLTLTAESVGASLGVGASTVRRLFEREGMTFSEYVLRFRLERAYRDLIDPRFGEHSIIDIAFNAGFADQSWFNRTFRRQFGASPSEVRAEFGTRAMGMR